MTQYAYVGSVNKATFAQLQSLLGWLQQGFSSDTPVPPDLQEVIESGSSPQLAMDIPAAPACEHRSYKRNTDLNTDTTTDTCSRCVATRPVGKSGATGPWA